MAETVNKSGLSRRSFLLRSGGVLGGLALGAYMAPQVKSLVVPKAFASGTPVPTGKASIEFNGDVTLVSGLQTDSNLASVVSTGGGDNILLQFAAGFSSYTAVANLCNVSDDTFTPIAAGDWIIPVSGPVVTATGCSLDGTTPFVLPTGADIGPLNNPGFETVSAPLCAPFPVTINLTAPATTSCEVKLKYIEVGTSLSGQTTFLTLSFEFV